jgi:hypothetical protein
MYEIHIMSPRDTSCRCRVVIPLYGGVAGDFVETMPPDGVVAVIFAFVVAFAINHQLPLISYIRKKL